MKTFRTLALAAVALGGIALATPAEARDHHRHYRYYSPRHHHGSVVIYSTPRYYYRPYYTPSYYYDDYYAPSYSYSRPYRYYGGPSISFAFGGHRSYHHR